MSKEELRNRSEAEIPASGASRNELPGPVELSQEDGDVAVGEFTKRTRQPSSLTPQTSGLFTKRTQEPPSLRASEPSRLAPYASRLLIACLALTFLTGCAPKSSTAPPTTTPKSVAKTAPADPWVLTCLDPTEKEPALLWNGLIGIRLGRDGSGAPGNTFFMIDEYEKSGEEKIIPLPNPAQIEARVGDNSLTDRSRMSNYVQRLDMRTSKLSTSWDESTKQGKAHVLVEAVVHPTQKNFAMRWTVTGPASGISVRVQEPPHSQCDQDTIGSQGCSRLGQSKIDWGFFETLHTTVKDTFQWECIWGFGSGSIGPTTFHVVPNSFTDVERAAKQTWAKRWQTDIEIDGPVADQQAIRSFLFYLRSAIHPKGGMSISPFGLSNATYNGHVFWDADIWCFPALALVDPQVASAIPKYRLDREEVAAENARNWEGQGRPTAGGKMGVIIPADSTSQWYFQPFMFPWESSVTGRETVPGPSKYEHHITGSVYHSLVTAEQLGLTDRGLEELTGEAGEFYLARSTKRSDGLLEIRDTMSPDENHTGNNDLYTNVLAEQILERYYKGGNSPKPPYMYFPHDDQTFLTYDNDPLKGYKQAAAVLSIYPLQFPPAEAQARKMMDRFADKVIKNGPAMTDSIHSIIWSRLGEKEKAYQSWQNSWVPFTQSPLLLFSEKRNRANTYFTTGAAGSLQSVLFGFLGFRIDWKKESGAAWTTQLRRDAWLSIKPNLPQPWKSVKFKNFTVLGRRYTLTATPSAVRVTPGE